LEIRNPGENLNEKWKEGVKDPDTKEQ